MRDNMMKTKAYNQNYRMKKVNVYRKSKWKSNERRKQEK